MATAAVRWNTRGEEQHDVIGLRGSRLTTRDDRGKLWTWLLPAGVCFEDSRARLVDPKAAAEAGRRAAPAPVLGV